MFGTSIFYSTNRYCYAEKNLSIHRFVQTKCSQCGRVSGYESISSGDDALLVSGGKLNPDFMIYGSVGLYFIVSERAMELIKREKISGYDKTIKVPIYRSRYGKLVQQDVCYYLVDIVGNIDLDLKAMSLKKKNICSACGSFDWNRQRLGIIDSVLDMSSWDGSDICRINSFKGHIVASDKFKELVEKNKLTGMKFKHENCIFKL